MKAIAIFFLVLSARAFAAAPPPADNVVLVTLDGTRWQEFLGNAPDAALAAGDKAPTFPTFWSTYAGQGVVLGDEDLGSVMTISNSVSISLPGYQSIMAGATQPCRDNDCGRITVETFPERLVRDLGLARSDAVVVASWDRIANAVEHVKGTLSVDAPPGTRDDAVTWTLAEAALAKKPRFLYISLNDADEFGHQHNYPQYLATLRRYDAWLDELFKTIAASGDWGNRTAVIVTTDHGRGLGPQWTDHGHIPAAHRIWLYARGSGIRSGGRLGKGFSGQHTDIRATIEALYGLAPVGTPLPILAR